MTGLTFVRVIAHISRTCGQRQIHLEHAAEMGITAAGRELALSLPKGRPALHRTRGCIALQGDNRTEVLIE